jgi:predicted nucleotidyltransferase
VQYRINNRGLITNEYIDLLNLQVSKLKNKEMDEIKKNNEKHTE